MTLLRTLAVLALLILSSACSTGARDPSQQILGSWQSTIGGFNVISTYTESEVAVDGHGGLPYVLDGQRLIVAGDATTAREVSFPSTDEMVQTDPMTGTKHTYSRVNN